MEEVDRFELNENDAENELDNATEVYISYNVECERLSGEIEAADLNGEHIPQPKKSMWRFWNNVREMKALRRVINIEKCYSDPFFDFSKKLKLSISEIDDIIKTRFPDRIYAPNKELKFWLLLRAVTSHRSKGGKNSRKYFTEEERKIAHRFAQQRYMAKKQLNSNKAI